MQVRFAGECRRGVAWEVDVAPKVCEFSDRFNRLYCDNSCGQGWTDGDILLLGLLPGCVQTHITSLKSRRPLVRDFRQQNRIVGISRCRSCRQRLCQNRHGNGAFNWSHNKRGPALGCSPFGLRRWSRRGYKAWITEMWYVEMSLNFYLKGVCWWGAKVQRRVYIKSSNCRNMKCCKSFNCCLKDGCW